MIEQSQRPKLCENGTYTNATMGWSINWLVQLYRKTNG